MHGFSQRSPDACRYGSADTLRHPFPHVPKVGPARYRARFAQAAQ
ncbi:hypothetical protein [Dyella sp.]